MQTTPPVILAIQNKQQVVQQSYKNLRIEINTHKLPTAKFYNQCINKHSTGIYCFLNHYQHIINNDAVAAVIHIFQNTIGICGIFSDHYSVLQSHNQVYKLLPAFHVQIYGNIQTISNVPLFLNLSNNLPIFDERLQHLHFYDIILKLSQQYTLYHIALPLFAIYDQQIDIQQDIAIVRSKYEQS